MQKLLFERWNANATFSYHCCFFIGMKKCAGECQLTHLVLQPWAPSFIMAIRFHTLSYTVRYKGPKYKFSFSFFLCKTQHFTKRKRLQRQSFSYINFSTPFKIHIYLPYPITWSKQKCLAYFADLKTSREKLGTFKTTIFYAMHLPVGELESIPPFSLN